MLVAVYTIIKNTQKAPTEDLATTNLQEKVPENCFQGLLHSVAG